MNERERHEAEPEANAVEPEDGQSRRGPSPEHQNAEKPTDQAISNQEQALESGEENVV